MPPYVPHSPDQIAQARTLYEETDLSPHDIARILGIGINTFYRRVKRWGWRRRRLRISEVDAMARDAAAARDAELAALGRRVVDDQRAAIDRAEGAILGQIEALEAMQERVALAALTVLDGERTGRALTALVKALAEVSRFRSEQGARAPRPEDERPSDPEGLREQLYLRLMAFQAQAAAEEAAEAARAAAEEAASGGA